MPSKPKNIYEKGNNSNKNVAQNTVSLRLELVGDLTLQSEMGSSILKFGQFIT